MATLSYLYPYFDHRIIPARTSFDAHSAVSGQAGSACLPDTVQDDGNYSGSSICWFISSRCAL